MQNLTISTVSNFTDHNPNTYVDSNHTHEDTPDSFTFLSIFDVLLIHILIAACLMRVLNLAYERDLKSYEDSAAVQEEVNNSTLKRE